MREEDQSGMTLLDMDLLHTKEELKLGQYEMNPTLLSSLDLLTAPGSPHLRDADPDADQSQSHSCSCGQDFLTKQTITGAYKRLIQQDLHKALELEKRHAIASIKKDSKRVDTTQWKSYKKKDNFRLYTKRKTLDKFNTSDAYTSPIKPQKNDTNLMTVMGMGIVQGTLEDMLYGKYTHSNQEMFTSMSFLIDDLLDCKRLETYEIASKEDPLRYFGMSYVHYRHHGTSFLSHEQDMCYVESMGIQTDTNGNRFAYEVVCSVDDPKASRNSKNKSQKKKTTTRRSKLSFTYIYRQEFPGTIHVFLLATYDKTCDSMETIEPFVLQWPLKSTSCSQSKKLTALAIRIHRKSAISRHHSTKTLEEDEEEEDEGPIPMLYSSTQVHCRVCKYSTRSSNLLLSLLTNGHRKLNWCDICCEIVCTKCMVEKTLFINGHHMKAFCCKQCLIQARHLVLLPRWVQDLKKAEQKRTSHGLFTTEILDQEVEEENKEDDKQKTKKKKKSKGFSTFTPIDWTFSFHERIKKSSSSSVPSSSLPSSSFSLPHTT